MKRQLIAITTAALLTVAVVSCRKAPSADVDPFLLAQRIASGNAPRIIDVRTPQEFSTGHVPGAVNIPHDQLAARLGDVRSDKGDEIVVYCQKGGRAKQAQQTLTGAGYTQVHHLEGDMQRWREAGYPTE